MGLEMRSDHTIRAFVTKQTNVMKIIKKNITKQKRKSAYGRYNNDANICYTIDLDERLQ